MGSSPLSKRVDFGRIIRTSLVCILSISHPHTFLKFIFSFLVKWVCVARRSLLHTLHLIRHIIIGWRCSSSIKCAEHVSDVDMQILSPKLRQAKHTTLVCRAVPFLFAAGCVMLRGPRARQTKGKADFKRHSKRALSRLTLTCAFLLLSFPTVRFFFRSRMLEILIV